MATVSKDGNQSPQRRTEQGGLVRREQPEIMREPFPSFMRDPFQAIMREPFRLMREMMIDPFRVFQQLAPWPEVGREVREAVWNPSFEIRETDDAFVIQADVPGVRQEDLDISLAGNNLRICGKREREQQAEEGTVHTYERSYGQFVRSFVLPESANLEKVRCDLKDGVLNLVVPKKEGAETHRRKIEIGAGTSTGASTGTASAKA